MTAEWNALPQIVISSPVLAIASGPGGIWAAGTGGIAWHATEGEWEPRIANLPLASVTALEFVDGRLIAGGVGGISVSTDGGVNWHVAGTEGVISVVTAIAVSPRFEEDRTALAATIDDGIWRSEDSGRSWRPATFGLLDFEAMDLSWGPSGSVLAATAGGIYRSPNEGRAWRRATGSNDRSVVAVAFLPDGTAVAATEQDGLLYSADGGAVWSPHGHLPQEVRSTALLATPDVLLLGTVEHGVLRSIDRGTTWTRVNAGQVYCLSADERALYAGATDGLLASTDGGVGWDSLPIPPVHDLRHFLIVHDRPLVFGSNTPPMLHDGSDWKVMPETPVPLTAMAVSPDGKLFASSPDGLFHSQDDGNTWQTAVSGVTGCVARITFAPRGLGLAGSADGARLLQTTDGGERWREIASPFGMLPLAALQAFRDSFVAITYDPRLEVAQVWWSGDDGGSWERGLQAKTAWPVVAVLDDPPLLTLGGTALVQGPDGSWFRTTVTERGGVRRVVGNGSTLLALTSMGIRNSHDRGATWMPGDEGLPADQILDIALSGDMLYALLTDGRVRFRAL